MVGVFLCRLPVVRGEGSRGRGQRVLLFALESVVLFNLALLH